MTVAIISTKKVARGLRRPRVALGSPLTKTAGETAEGRWTVANGGDATGYASLELVNQVGDRIGTFAIISIPSGAQIGLRSLWSDLPAGSYGLTLVLREHTADGGVVREMARDTANILVNPARPAARFTVGQRVHYLSTVFVGTVEKVYWVNTQWNYDVRFSDPRINPLVTFWESALEPDPGIPITAPVITNIVAIGGRRPVILSAQAANYKGEDLSTEIRWWRRYWDPLEESFLFSYIGMGASVSVMPDAGQTELVFLTRVEDVNSGLTTRIESATSL